MHVHHYGPSTSEVGGMGTVLSLIEEFRIGADEVTVHPTFSRGARARTAGLAIRALAGLSRVSADVVHVHLSIRGSFIREGAVLRRAKHLGFPTAVTLHGAEFTDTWRRWPRLTTTTLRHADLVVALDPDLVGPIERVTDSVVACVANPAVIDREAPSCSITAPVALFAGELSVRKGVDVLASAWPAVRAEIPDAELLVIGPPRNTAPPEGPGVTVLAPSSPARVRELLRGSRCAVLPSRSEALPMFLIEAMACGRPFIATPVGGIPSLGAGGTIVPVADPAALARALVAFLGDAEHAEAVGLRGRRSAEETRSVETVDRRLRELYRAAVGRAAAVGVAAASPPR